MPDIQTLITEATEKLKAAQKQQFDDLQKEVDEAKQKGEGLADVTAKFEKVNGEVAGLVDQIKDLSEKQAAEKSELTGRLAEFERKYGAPDVGGRKTDSYGARFVKAVGDESAWETADQNGRTDKRKLEKAAAAYLSGGVAALRKEISGASDSAGGLQDSLRVPGVITPPDTAFTVQDLLPRQTTTNRSVDYVRELLLTNNAAAVAENTAVSGATEKPKSDISFESVNEPMHTIATWVPASREILKYANRTQLQNYIDGRLRYMVGLRFEEQILTGDGTGNNLSGLVTQASTYDRGYETNDTKLDTLRRARTQARLAEYPVTGQVLNPADWEDIELAKGSDLHYIFANPGQVVAPRLWGVPVAESTKMTEGEFLVGAFSLGAELFIGEDIMVEATKYHADFFTKNLVAILAEMDALLAVYRPSAFVSGPFEAATT